MAKFIVERPTTKECLAERDNVVDALAFSREHAGTLVFKIEDGQKTQMSVLPKRTAQKMEDEG